MKIQIKNDFIKRYENYIIIGSIVILVIIAGMSHLLFNDREYQTSECSSDDDCVLQGQCCHPMAAECVPIESYVPPFNCASVACTQECEPCSLCSCENGKCYTYKTTGCC